MGASFQFIYELGKPRSRCAFGQPYDRNYAEKRKEDRGYDTEFESTAYIYGNIRIILVIFLYLWHWHFEMTAQCSNF